MLLTRTGRGRARRDLRHHDIELEPLTGPLKGVYALRTWRRPPEIARKLVIPSGKNKGEHPSVATVYRVLAEADGTA